MVSWPSFSDLGETMALRVIQGQKEHIVFTSIRNKFLLRGCEEGVFFFFFCHLQALQNNYCCVYVTLEANIYTEFLAYHSTELLLLMLTLSLYVISHEITEIFAISYHTIHR